jgi:hypothetical protein
MIAAEPTLSKSAAEEKLWTSNPELYGRVREEERKYAKENRRD